MWVNAQALLTEMVGIEFLLNWSCILIYICQDQLRHYAELKRLLADIDTPVRRMNDGLSMIQDDLQG
jgi:hypothetical protein